MSLVLPLPDAVLAWASPWSSAEFTLGFCWTPAMALLSDSVERTGLEQWVAFAMVNLGWAGGQVIGGSGGGGLADATSDAVPFGVVAALLALTAAAVSLARSRVAAAGPVTE